MTKKERIVVAVLSFWTIIHLTILIISFTSTLSSKEDDIFYPFADEHYYSRTGLNNILYTFSDRLFYMYDYSEFLVYVGIPLLIYGLFKFRKSDKKIVGSIKYYKGGYFNFFLTITGIFSLIRFALGLYWIYVQWYWLERYINPKESSLRENKFEPLLYLEQWEGRSHNYPYKSIFLIEYLITFLGIYFAIRLFKKDNIAGLYFFIGFFLVELVFQMIFGFYTFWPNICIPITIVLIICCFIAYVKKMRNTGKQ